MKASAKSSKRKFDDFIADDPSLVDALTAAKQFVADIKSHPYNDGYCLSLCGKSGTGKTMLTEIILNELKCNSWGGCDAVPQVVRCGKILNRDAFFCYMPQISDGFKAGRFSIVETMEEKWLTVLDDIGADYDPSKITASKVDRVLRMRKGKWTLATFNLPLNEIATKVDARVASFIIRDGNKFVEIRAQDFALRKLRGK
jgi:DNA replication protein DnaC